MAKMNTKGASPSKLVPPGSWNHNAKMPFALDNMANAKPDNRISTVN